jgi:AraC-like DNA-binding protein
VRFGVIAKGGEQLSPDFLVLKVVLRAHDKFPINELVNVSLIRQRLKFGFRPGLFSGLDCGIHRRNIINDASTVETSRKRPVQPRCGALRSLRNSRQADTEPTHWTRIVANARMRSAHLTLHEVVLPPSAEWLSNFSGWFFARIVQGWAYALQSHVACPLEEGQVLVTCSIRPVVLRSSQIGETKVHWFRLCPERLPGFFTLLEQHYLEFVAPKRKPALRAICSPEAVARQFAELSSEWPRGNSLVARSQMLSIVVSALHNELSPYQFKSEARQNASGRFRELVAAVPAAEIQDVPVAELARQCGCSERHFSRLFRAQFGFSLRARQTEQRLRKAQQLLLESDRKVSFVAMETGFHHVAFFNAMFKKRFGLTPSEWRQQSTAES